LLAPLLLKIDYQFRL